MNHRSYINNILEFLVYPFVWLFLILCFLVVFCVFVVTITIIWPILLIPDYKLYFKDLKTEKR